MTERPVPKCRFCGDPAIVHVALSKGCACYPDDREQWLCAHHEWKSTPLGSFEVKQVLGMTRPGSKTRSWSEPTLF